MRMWVIATYFSLSSSAVSSARMRIASSARSIGVSVAPDSARGEESIAARAWSLSFSTLIPPCVKSFFVGGWSISRKPWIT